ncbi:MAG TPA: response regulator [Gammaproteobacteria bacterium]|nr:response regulator [Gammaproteobacteria bacterium]
MPKRVLVIDDEPLIRDVVCKFLRRSGYDTDTAANGMEGIDRFREVPADLVITDLTMPEMDGMQTVKELLAEFPQAKVITMSGGGDRFPEHCLRESVELGAAGSLKKPIRGRDLVIEVQRIIGTAE